jgi:KDO2-lipid IV(A) lauroyltransferase
LVLFLDQKKLLEKNISLAFSESDKKFKNTITKNMWKNYGKIFAEYMFLKHFRKIKSESF